MRIKSIPVLGSLLSPLLAAGGWWSPKEKRRKRKEKELAEAYERLVLQNRFALDHVDIMDARVIALDRKTKQLLLLDHSESSRQELCIALSVIEAVKLVEEKAGDNGGKKLSLELACKGGAAVHRFCFFSEAADKLTLLPHLFRRALQWKHRIDMHRRHGGARRELTL